jgi:hypothetical protein
MEESTRQQLGVIPSEARNLCQRHYSLGQGRFDSDELA